jgi:hypothetical protein
LRRKRRGEPSSARTCPSTDSFSLRRPVFQEPLFSQASSSSCLRLCSPSFHRGSAMRIRHLAVQRGLVSGMGVSLGTSTVQCHYCMSQLRRTWHESGSRATSTVEEMRRCGVDVGLDAAGEEEGNLKATKGSESVQRCGGARDAHG